MSTLATYAAATALALVLQLVATRLTHAKRWSRQAMVRNVAIACVVAAIARGASAGWLLLVVVLEVAMELINARWVSIDPWLTTDYLYSDYFESFVNEGPKALRYYTEGTYAAALGVDTLDTGPENVSRVIDYGQRLVESVDVDRGTVAHADGVTELAIDRVADDGQLEKFRWIAEQCGIGPGTRVLEIGFGKADLMHYLRSTGADVTGINVSAEQVRQARADGFRAECGSFWELENELGVGQDYDVIISNGSVEYCRLLHEPEERYRRFFEIIRARLKPSGVYLCATLHRSESAPLTDLGWTYYLWSGNDGSYPVGRAGLTRFATSVGFQVVRQENRWLDYYLYSCLWIAAFRCRFRTGASRWRAARRWLPMVIANPHVVQSIVTYAFFGTRVKSPWLRQFLPRGDGTVPVSHEWIVLRNA